MSKKILITVIVIELMVSIYLGIAVYSIRRNCLNLVNIQKSEIFELKSKSNYLTKINNYRLLTENLKIDISDNDVKNLDLAIVLRIHENICIKCFTTAIKHSIINIKRNKQRLVILSSYQFNSVMYSILSDLGLSEFENINLGDNFTLPADSADSPYFFTISKNKIIKNTYVLQKDNLQSLNFYFNSLNSTIPRFQ